MAPAERQLTHQRLVLKIGKLSDFEVFGVCYSQRYQLLL